MAFEWFITANLGNDPRPFKTHSGKEGVNLTVACNVPIEKTDEKEAVWIDATIWGWQAELVEGLQKGDGVCLRGRVRRKNYEHNGELREVWTMQVNEVITEKVFHKSGNGGQTPHQEQKSNGYQPQPKPAAKQEDFDDDIPF